MTEASCRVGVLRLFGQGESPIVAYPLLGSGSTEQGTGLESS